MEILDRLTAWLRRNVWCFVVATLLTIFWMAAFWYVDQGAAIATWLSIILAVVVIMYTFLETYRSGQRLSEMRELVRKGQDIIAIKADELKTETKSMKNTQQDIEKIVADLQEGPSLTGMIEPSNRPQFLLNIAESRWVQTFALYCMAKSAKSKHPLDIKALAKAIYERPGYRGVPAEYTEAPIFLNGIFMGISCFLDHSSVMLNESSLKVIRFPDDAADLISESIQQQIDNQNMSDIEWEHFKAIKDNIDLVVANPPTTEKSTQ